MKKIVLATNNKGKVREFQAALATLGLEGVPIKEVCQVEEPEETGHTFMENAFLKATYYMKACGLPCLADDSGLEVEALGGAPGIYSARYAGVHGDDEANNQKLLDNLAEVPLAERQGRYVCALALVYPDGRKYSVEGYCEGLIQDERCGTGGFGYDPYFYLPQFGTTIANISLEQKNEISHRGKALQALVAQLREQA